MSSFVTKRYTHAKKPGNVSLDCDRLFLLFTSFLALVIAVIAVILISTTYFDWFVDPRNGNLTCNRRFDYVEIGPIAKLLVDTELVLDNSNGVINNGDFRLTFTGSRLTFSSSDGSLLFFGNWTASTADSDPSLIENVISLDTGSSLGKLLNLTLIAFNNKQSGQLYHGFNVEQIEFLFPTVFESYSNLSTIHYDMMIVELAASIQQTFYTLAINQATLACSPSLLSPRAPPTSTGICSCLPPSNITCLCQQWMSTCQSHPSFVICESNDPLAVYCRST